MKGYVDFFILTIPKKNLPAYLKMAKKFKKVITEHGALAYREFVGDDLKAKMGAPFTSKFKLKPGEVLVSSVIEYESKAHRNKVNKKLMKDPIMKAMADMPPLFDCSKMLYGGFATILST